MSPKIVLHYLDQSRADRIIWLLEELGLDYELKTYKRGRDMVSPPELKRVHPLGKSPVLEVDGKKLIESGYIVDYVIRHFDNNKVLAADNEEDAEKISLALHHAEGSIMTPFIVALITTKIREGPFLARPLLNIVAGRVESSYAVPNINLQLDYLEQLLKDNGSNGLFVGEHLTGADIIYMFPLRIAKERNFLSIQRHPNILKYLETIQARDAYKRAETREREAGMSKI
uniref:glutathione transferase n=1 Tax=Blastobotrys adeninivorans TaxID=409370 RepID=A0A060THY1_BLAAD